MQDRRITKPSQHWAVWVEVPGGETQTEKSHKGMRFTADRLNIRSNWSGIGYYLFGTNIRQDGTAGRLTLSRVVDREHLDYAYPETMAAAKAALTELAAEIIQDAKAACSVIYSLAGE